MSGPLAGAAGKTFANLAYPKFAATADDESRPNVVPLLSARKIDDDHLAFVRFMVWKTRRNFEHNGRITIGCTGPRGRSNLALGRFEEWVTQGPLLERFEAEPLFRYNAYMGANMIGVIKVNDVIEFAGSGLAGPLLKSFAARFGKEADESAPGPAGGESSPVMPLQVTDKWRRSIAVKFLGMVREDGEPLAIPCQGLSARDGASLSFPMPKNGDNPLGNLKEGDSLAASVIVPDPIAYQVKGKFAGSGRGEGVLYVNEVFTASPPAPGRRIYPPEDV